MDRRPMMEAGIEIGLTIQPAQYESIRVSASFRKEAPADFPAEELFAEVQAEVERQVAKVLTETQAGYHYLKNGGS